MADSTAQKNPNAVPNALPLPNPNAKAVPDPNAVPNSAASMLFFLIVTSIYCIISIFMGSVDMTTKLIMKVGYILFVITGEYFINLNLSKTICGTNQWSSTIMITFIPWLVIFGVLHLFLIMFPGWLSPFANTFGYLVVKLMGLPDLMKDILEPAAKGETERAILSVAVDDSLLVNQFYPEAYVDQIGKDGQPTGLKTRKIFDTAWDKLQTAGIIKKFEGDPGKNKSFREKFYKYVEMKYTVAEYVWNILTGLLVTSVSYNYIINTGCEKSVVNMKAQHDAYQAKQRAKLSQKAAEQASQPKYQQT
jgi:hypothetical protein